MYFCNFNGATVGAERRNDSETALMFGEKNEGLLHFVSEDCIVHVSSKAMFVSHRCGFGIHS